MEAMSDDIKKAKYLIEKQEFAKRIHVLEQGATSGDAEAQFQLGLTYYRGVHVPVDTETAWKWFKEADINGHIKAPYYIGRICTYYAEQAISEAASSEESSSREVAEEWHQTAMRWYVRSTERGYHPAMTRVGANYMAGTGTVRNWDKAYEYFVQAKAAGNYMARAKMARMLIQGHKGFSGIFIGLYEFFSALYSFLTDASRKTYESEDEMKEITLA